MAGGCRGGSGAGRPTSRTCTIDGVALARAGEAASGLPGPAAGAVDALAIWPATRPSPGAARPGGPRWALGGGADVEEQVAVAPGERSGLEALPSSDFIASPGFQAHWLQIVMHVSQGRFFWYLPTRLLGRVVVAAGTAAVVDDDARLERADECDEQPLAAPPSKSWGTSNHRMPQRAVVVDQLGHLALDVLLVTSRFETGRRTRRRGWSSGKSGLCQSQTEWYVQNARPWRLHASANSRVTSRPKGECMMLYR